MARGLLRFPAPDCIACNTTVRGEPETHLLIKRRCAARGVVKMLR
jgi:hypothetical protein